MADETNVSTAVVDQPAIEQPQPQTATETAAPQEQQAQPEPTEREKQIKRSERKIERLDEEIRSLERRYNLSEKQSTDDWMRTRNAQVNGTLEDLQARDAQQRQALLLEKLTEQQALSAMRQDQQQPQPIQWNPDQYEQVREQVRVEEGHRLRLQSASKQYPDWEKTHEAIAANDVRLPDAVADAIRRFDNGPDVVYALAKNPDEARELSNMPLHMALAKIGRMSAQIEAKAASGQRTSNAPAPARPVSGRGHEKPFDPNDDTIPVDEWMQKRNAQVAARQGR